MKRGRRTVTSASATTRHHKTLTAVEQYVLATTTLFALTILETKAEATPPSGPSFSKYTPSDSSEEWTTDTQQSYDDLFASMSDGFLQFSEGSDLDFVAHTGDNNDETSGYERTIYEDEYDERNLVDASTPNTPVHRHSTDQPTPVAPRRVIPLSNNTTRVSSATNLQNSVVKTGRNNNLPLEAAVSKKDIEGSKEVIAPRLQSTEKADQTTSPPGISPWIRRYLSTRPSLLVVPRDFLLDNFNLAQLAGILESWVQVLPQARGVQFPTGWLYKQALQRLVAQNMEDTAAVAGVADDIVDWAASLLYQLVHQRYAVSPQGLEALRRRFVIWQYQSAKDRPMQLPPYGRCPRPACRGFALVPSGPDNPVDAKGTVEDVRPWRYCGLCRETWRAMDYAVESAEGCAWGTTVGPLFHLSYPLFLKDTEIKTALPCTSLEPRIFGFRLHPGATGLMRRER